MKIIKREIESEANKYARAVYVLKAFTRTKSSQSIFPKKKKIASDLLKSVAS